MTNQPHNRGQFRLSEIGRRLEIPQLRLRGTTPINKVERESTQAFGRKLPQIDNPLLVGAAAVAAVGFALGATRLRSGGRDGRSDRFRTWVEQTVEQFLDKAALPAESVCKVAVDVLEGFGKLPTVNVDISVEQAEGIWSETQCSDLLEYIAQSVWDNPEMAPVAVRGRIVDSEDQQQIADMTVAGFEDEVARPQDLLDRFGSPASDPTWNG